MQVMIDCDVLDYCHDSSESRQEILQTAALSANKPVYGISVFELCRALHLLRKIYGFDPAMFRTGWAELSQVHEAYMWDAGGYFIHICEYPDDERDKLPASIRDLGSKEGRIDNESEVPCENDPELYWDQHLGLTKRLRELHSIELDILQNNLANMNQSQRQWIAIPPTGKNKRPTLRLVPDTNNDIVLDTNNLLALINRLPADGTPIDANQLNLPRRLTENPIRRFKTIIETRGVSGKFIVPVSVLEEAERVAFRQWGNYRHKHVRAQEVLESFKFDPDRPLWQIFDFEPLTQEILDHFILLHEEISTRATDDDHWPDFGDALVLAHGLYHGCQVASNEWFEKDDWAVVKEAFPHLVLE